MAILLAAQLALAIASMRGKSVTVDEITYIATGYYHLTTGDFRVNMTHPPLIKMVSAAPLLLLGAKLPTIDSPPVNWSLIEQWRFARRFMFDNDVDADRLLFAARLGVLLLMTLAGVFVFRWAAALYGDGAGLAALALYALSPNVLAHGRLATNDVGVTAMMFIAIYYFWRFMREPSTGALVLCGVFVALAALSKTTAVFLVPVFVLYGALCVVRGNGHGVLERLPLVRRVRPERVRLRQFVSLCVAACVLGAIAVFIINACYLFDGTFGPYDLKPRAAGTQQSWLGWGRGLMGRIPLPLPFAFVEIARFQSGLAASSGDVFFAGKLHANGLWYLMSAAFALKTPIALHVLLLGAVAALVARLRRLDAEWLLIAQVAVIMAVFSYMSQTNMGLRYVLPIFPCLHVLVAGLPGAPWGRGWPARAAFGVLLAWYAVSGIGAHPHYLAYFNEYIGGPDNGYRYLTDSFVDWGQDLKGLKGYMDARGIDRIKLAYFGSADANYYDIDYDYLPSVGLAPREAGQRWWYEYSPEEPAMLAPQKGLLAVSATLWASPGWVRQLFGDSYGWLKDYEPIDQIGHSILIYDIK